ncbi:MAG: hypothetical protein ACRDLV_15085, partial [Solirubrobacteraceae bacterium]
MCSASLLVPYLSTGVAAIRVALDAPPAAVAMPVLSLPIAPFPGLGAPMLHHYPQPSAPAIAVASGAAPAPPTAAVGQTALQPAQRVVVVRHVVRPTIPVIHNSYSLGSSAAARKPVVRSASSGVVAGLAGAVANAPVVSNDSGAPVPTLPPAGATVAPQTPTAPSPAAAAGIAPAPSAT